MVKTTKDVLRERVLDVLNKAAKINKQKSRENWIILFHGEQVVLYNGKRIWNKKGHAMRALVDKFWYHYNYAEAKEVVEDLEKEKILEFKKI